MRIEKADVVLDNHHKNVLVKEWEIEYGDIQKFDVPENVVKVMNDVFHMKEKAEEYLYVLCMTSAGDPIAIFELSHGTYNSSLVGCREIFIRALLCGATNIILIHNHPSGCCRPSKEDNKVTLNVRKACDIIGLGFCDHIIIGGNEWYSFKQEQCENREGGTDDFLD